MYKLTLNMVVALAIVTILAACATTFSLPKTTKSGSINQENYSKMHGPASLNGIIVGWAGLPLPAYTSFSIYRGDKPFKHNPKTKIAHAETGTMSIRIRAEGASKESVEVAQGFVTDFARIYADMDQKTWHHASLRTYDIELLMFPPGTKINRQYRQVLLGHTFHTQFYFPFYQSDKARNFGQMYGIAEVLAHEHYHLRASPLGGTNEQPFRKDLNKWQRHVLEEAAGKFIGACAELKIKKIIGIGSGVVFSMKDKDSGLMRFGTLSDRMILAVLKPDAKIAPEDFVPLGPMLFATYWAEKADARHLIHEGEDAATAIEEICENHIAHPTDLWPVFWKMANDGVDAPVFTRKLKPKTGS